MKVRPPEGLIDLEPEDMRILNYIVDQLKEVFEKNGFEPIDTPAFEKKEVLFKKYGAEEKLIYEVGKMGKYEYALRYDLTVPLARYVVSHIDKISIPFKRYHIGKVWRGERPKRGRFREFLQADFDIVGTESMFADAFIVKVLIDALRKIGIEDHFVALNNRKILFGFLDELNIKGNNGLNVLRTIDKIDKIGKAAVVEKLNEIMGKQKCEKLLEWLNVKEVEEVRELNEKIAEGKKELLEIFDFLEKLGVSERYVRYTPELVRGLDYYTGPIYEAIHLSEKIGSIAGGGRYDELIGIFLGRKIPATGASLGVFRILEILKTLGKTNTTKERKPIALVVYGRSFEKGLEVFNEVRKKGICVDIYPDSNATVKAQLKYADKKKIRYAILAFEDKLALKDLSSAKQENMTLDEIINFLSKV